MSQITDQLKKLVSIALQSENSMEYVSEMIRKVRPDFFVNPFWHSILSIAQDAMKEYEVMRLDESFFTRYIEKRKLAASMIITFKDFMRQDEEKLSIHRFKLELDIYIETMAVLSLKETIGTVAKDLGKDSYEQSRSGLMLGVSNIDSGIDNGKLPEGELLSDMGEVLDDFKEAENAEGNPDVILSGFPTLDAATGGFVRGDLIFITAYAGEGKSTVALNVAYNAVMTGKNVVYFINELQYKQLRLKLVSRHTAHPKFWNGQMGGVPSKGIHKGDLTSLHRKVMKAAVHDLKTNKEYGKIYLVQLPNNASLSYVEAKMTAYQAMTNLDLCIVDDIRLVRGDLKGNDKEVLSKVVVHAKSIAVNFNGGLGIPLISPWQTKQVAYERALEEGEYRINSNSDTNEIEKQADILLWLLRTKELERKNQILCGCSKNRMGDKPDKFPFMEAFEYSYTAELTGVKVSDTGTSTIPEGDYSSLLKETLSI